MSRLVISDSVGSEVGHHTEGDCKIRRAEAASPERYIVSCRASYNRMIDFVSALLQSSSITSPIATLDRVPKPEQVCNLVPAPTVDFAAL